MANWAETVYRFEGPEETLRLIYEAMQNPTVKTEDASEGWQGDTLKSLGISPEGHYTRGFLQECEIGKAVYQEAWGRTDFADLLKKKFPEVKIYWNTEEFEDDVWATNDSEKKYFTARFSVDYCVGRFCDVEYFDSSDEMFSHLIRVTDGMVNSMESAEAFNKESDEAGTGNYVIIHMCKVIEDSLNE